ncbi:hypothetical protein TREES_T100015034 [Tupaia chinensis]|uniref:Uncharacterized protein n=1 Tax=Tupaia chinensis TaxID=246437 RepID=L9KI99_TUPCH|nr:hypothetical protein TREES_T100015034 [Tupaia chinensis]
MSRWERSLAGRQRHFTAVLKDMEKEEEKPSCWSTIGEIYGQDRAHSDHDQTKQKVNKTAAWLASSAPPSRFPASLISYSSDSSFQPIPILIHDEDNVIGFPKY